MLTINNFDDWTGDLVLPGELFFENFFSSAIGLSGDADIENNNDATVENNGELGADSGDNEANANGGDSAIVTGDANSSINVHNEVNSNLIGGASLLILIRVHGDWDGDIFSLPKGASWGYGPEGLSIYGLNLGGEGDPPAGEGGGGLTSLDLTNNNIGSVENNLRIFALTGANQASANGGDALILTGDANAGANIVNFVNTNIIGRNWLLALVNIFGDWNGNLAFGRPDLWVGGTAQVDPAKPGGHVEYQMTIFNRGDSPATGVKLASAFDERLLRIKEHGEGTNGGNTINWDLGMIPIGESVTVSYTAAIDEGLPFGDSTITNTASVTSFETDDDTSDNTDVISFSVFNNNIAAPGGPPNHTAVEKPKLELYKRIRTTGPVRHGESIDFQIKLTNSGRAPAYQVETTDWILDSEENIIKEQKWNLQEVLADEEVFMDYTLEINGNAPAGTYRATTFATGRDGQNNFIRTEDVVIEFEVIDDVAAGSGKEITIESIGPVDFAAENVLGALSGTAEAETKVIEAPLSLSLAQGLPLPELDVVDTPSSLGLLAASLADTLNSIPLPAAVLALDMMLVMLLFFVAKRDEDEETKKVTTRYRRRRK